METASLIPVRFANRVNSFMLGWVVGVVLNVLEQRSSYSTIDIRIRTFQSMS